MASGGVDRELYQSFWDKYSARADNTSMLLNANADQIEALDRADILAHLPSVQGKFVVDIGAGIGRFTTAFAQSGAQHVVSTDFVDSFIEKNRERNAAFPNVEWRVGDALGLDLAESSVDLVFTNWLLMYMSDAESVRFVANALGWLRPEGYLHLRESCSEPSTLKSTAAAGASLHSQSEPNPTRYRFSSVYIELLRSLRHQDTATGKWWRFEVHWACSVDVYIERQLNWRQVHWLARKVTAEDPNIPPSVASLADSFGSQWPREQLQWDERAERSAGQNLDLGQLLRELELPVGGTNTDPAAVFGFNARKKYAELALDAHQMAKQLDSRVWLVEREPFAYRHALTLANRRGDRRIRLGWHSTLKSALDFWLAGSAAVDQFNALVVTELMAELNGDSSVLRKLAQLLPNGGRLVALELVDPDGGGEECQLRKRAGRCLGGHFSVDRMAQVATTQGGKHVFAIWATVVKAKAPQWQGETLRRINAGF